MKLRILDGNQERMGPFRPNRACKWISSQAKPQGQLCRLGASSTEEEDLSHQSCMLWHQRFSSWWCWIFVLLNISKISNNETINNANKRSSFAKKNLQNSDHIIFGLWYSRYDTQLYLFSRPHIYWVVLVYSTTSNYIDSAVDKHRVQKIRASRNITFLIILWTN